MNITLIGMAGAGKTTIGKVLAKKLNMNFIDTDCIITNTYKTSISELIENKGALNFIDLENKAITDTKFENHVISTGGSVIYGESAMKYLNSISTVIYLDVPLYKIKLRVKDMSARGIVSLNGHSINDIFFERLPYYEKYCDFRILCKRKTVSQITNEIIDKI